MPPKKTPAEVKPSVAVASSPTPAPAAVTPKLPAVPAVAKAVPAVKPVSKPEPVAPAPVAPAADPVPAADSQPAEEEGDKTTLNLKKRARAPRVKSKARSFAETRAELTECLKTAFEQVQSAQKLLKALEQAHNREVHDTKSRDNTARTPTIVFDQALVDYFRSRLPADKLVVKRKTPNGDEPVDLSDLTTETRLHRTDVTQLYNAVFREHNMSKPDGRYISYETDPDLVNLLTTGNLKPENAALLPEIKAGTYKLSIFNIQKFTNQHLSKVAKPEKPAEAPVASA